MGFLRLVSMNSRNKVQVDSRENLQYPEDAKYVYKVHRIRVMEGEARKEDAQKILEEVARQVQPIMIRHKWAVCRLSEYRTKGFWGQNSGYEIKLNIRIHNTADEFHPFEEIVDTMLHELCHIVYRHHDADFHKLLNELKEEYEELTNKGIISASSEDEYFDLRGWRLRRSSCFPLHSMWSQFHQKKKLIQRSISNLFRKKKKLTASNYLNVQL